MKKMKKPSLRMCLGCGEMIDKRELIRIVKGESVSIDITGKSPGRGAYICGNIECFKKARKNRRLEKGFSQKIPDEIYNTLETQILNLPINQTEDVI